MEYAHVEKATFLNRPNRFVANVLLDGREETVHVKNTGRCQELLLPESTVYLAEAQNPERKTRYDLIAVEKKREGKSPLLINMDSQIPNGATYEWLLKGNLFSENATIRREVTYGKSRFDIYVEDGDRRAFIEVKGVTLEKDGVAMFPDAPTERGIKHLRELISSMRNGYEAYVIFVIQMKEISSFCPNDETHRAFGDTLREASAAGVRVLAYDCAVTADSIALDQPIQVRLD
jgi:sugar fermentation stimulation protein A